MKKKRIIIALGVLVVLVVGLFILQKTISRDASVKEPATTGKGSGQEEEDLSDGPPVIGFSCADLEDPYCSAMEAAVRMSAKSNGLRVMVRDARKSSSRQKHQLERFVERHVDAVMIAPVSQDDILETVQLIKDADIPVVIVDSRISDMSLASCFVGADRIAGGSLCGNDLRNRLPDGGTMLIVESASRQAVTDSITGFENACAGGGFTVAGRSDCAGSRVRAARYVKEMLAEVPDVSAVMCGSDAMALGAASAVREYNAQHPDEPIAPIIYGIGGYPEMKRELAQKDSLVTATATTSPLAVGQDALAAAAALINGEHVEEETLERPFLVDHDNIELYGTDGWQ